MSTWPDTMKVAPIREWPGELSRNRSRSLFKAGLVDTLDLLDREIWHLCDTRSQRESAELLIAIPAGALWRQDGRPRAHAAAEHPGVIFSLESKHGSLSYPCDTFTTWQDNLRAVALALEALRKVDRYGVTKRGEQYRGFLAIEATAAPSGFSTATEALRYLREVSGIPADLYEPPEAHMPRVIRAAQRRAHPDTGGDSATFQRVSLAEAKLREEGLVR
ncbi:molecular chaperone DnaJ [Microbacterium sp. 4-7]|uniref:molecular chaperone DnaJ n=1 Tax=Microbacterium sp. 4-7 TaxID=1885327 RepID=UPI00164FA0D6|nr:molecular chaperone DnaJ [Microbacterium sp. 4-7]MBC6496087.1 hypothetical protein [Microbacterium sp. 4-7]